MELDAINTLLSFWMKPMIVLVLMYSVLSVSFVFSASYKHWFITLILVAVFVSSFIAWGNVRIPLGIVPHQWESLFAIQLVQDSMWSLGAQVFLALYCFGFLWVVFYQIVGIVDVMQLTRRSKVLVDVKVDKILSRLRQRLPVSRDIELRKSNEVASPFAWGWHKPVIIFPETYSAWTPERLERVLCHEMTHVQRHDWLVKLITKIICAVFWWVPLVWLYAKKQDWYAELACDDSVVNVLSNRPEYAEDLIAFAGVSYDSSWVMHIVDQSHLYQRIEHVLDGRQQRTPIHGLERFALACVSLALIVPIGFVQAVPAPITLAAPVIDTLPFDTLSREVDRVEHSDPVSISMPSVILIENDRPQEPRFESVNLVAFKQPFVQDALLVSKAELSTAERIKSPNVQIRGVIPQQLVTPVYPKRAVDRNIEGLVIVQFDIDEIGRVVEPRVVVSQPKRVFDKSVLKALRQSLFQPMVMDGQKVKIRNVSETFTFKLYESTTKSKVDTGVSTPSKTARLKRD